MLNVNQLIQEHSKYPPKMFVMVDGYEGGYNAVVAEKIYHELVCYSPQEEYYGDYHAAQSARAGHSSEFQTVLVISRKGGENSINQPYNFQHANFCNGRYSWCTQSAFAMPRISRF